MNKKLLWGAMSLAGMLSFASCSSDDSPESNENLQATGEQVIMLDMQDTDDLVTRGRPLYSTENKGAELVTDVRLFVFKIDGTSRTLVNVIPVSNWNVVSSEYNYGNKYTLKLTGDNKLELGSNYEILAVGQDESDTNDAYSINLAGKSDGVAVQVAEIEKYWTTTTGPTWNPTATAGNGFATTVAKASQNEIYSGISDPINLEVSVTGAFNCTVLLKRQVAGVLGYFCNIPGKVQTGEDASNNPTFTDVKYIRLVASNANTQIDLSHQLHVQLDDATHESPSEEGIENIVNGFTKPEDSTAEFANGNSAYEVYTIDLTQWFTSTAEEGAGVWGTEDIETSTEEKQGDVRILKAGWKNPLDATNSDKLVLDDGTVFAGKFVIPFDRLTSDYTFELQLLAADGSTILKKWDVVLDAASQDENNTKYNYNIYRNHLYQIGQRGDTDKPDAPGTGDDKPQPLDKSQDIVIKINDNWEFIHNMEIE